jgi:alanyl-tRNA synthetase
VAADDKVRSWSSARAGSEKEVEQLKAKLASAAGSDLDRCGPSTVDGVKVLAARLDGADAKSLRDTLDQLQEQARLRRGLLAAPRATARST